MTLSHPEMETVLNISSDAAFSVAIENRHFFYKLVTELLGQINGDDGGGFVLADERGKLLALSKSAELIHDFLGFDINQKSLITKIISAMDKNATDNHYEDTIALLTGLEKYVDDISQDFSCDIICSKINVPAILKMAGISIRDEYTSPLERIIDYMELVREFDRDKLFIFVNLRAFFNDEETEIFLETAISHEYKILLFDSYSHKLLRSEKRLIIDEDLCEI